MMMMMNRYAIVLVLSLCVVQGREVPTKKAMPPLMDPIPTMPEITNRVYFDIEIDGKSSGRIHFGLFGKNSPDAVENFLALAKCDLGTSKTSGKDLCYKNTIFHRIIPNFGIQGGDFTHFDGTGGRESIHANNKDKPFQPQMRELTKFNKPYMLAMASPLKSSSQKSEASSQFFVTTVKAQWLTGKHTIFGMVLEGSDVIDEIEKYGTYGGKPRSTVTIVKCGEEPLQSKDKEPHY